MSNASLRTADQMTHLKIVVLSLIASVGVMVVGISARADLWRAADVAVAAAHVALYREKLRALIQNGDQYLLTHAPEEIIRSVQRGIYAVNFGGGQVDITSGKFVFSASEAYAIENGRVGAPLKGATLIGNGPDVLTRVSMVGNDLKLDDGVGTCGKDGQSVPVGVGQPTLRIEGLTVGGTA